MNKRTTVALACSTAFLMGLSSLGCVPQERLDATVEDAAQNPAPFLGTDDSTTETILQSTPKHVSGDYGQILSIDADVKTPKVAELGRIETKTLEWPLEAVAAMLFREEVPAATTATEPGTDIVRHYFETDTELLIVGGGGLLYRYDSGDIPYAAAMKEPQWENRLDEAFPPHELAFMPLDEALEKSRGFIADLGLETADEAFVNSLSHDLLNDALREAEEKGGEGYVYKGAFGFEFTQDDDMYRIVVPLAIDGVSLTDVDYVDRETDNLYIGSYAEIWIAADGVRMVDISSGPAPAGVKRHSGQRILTLEEAIAAISRQYDDVIMTNRTSIVSVELAYVRRPNPSSDQAVMVFTPAWVMKAPPAYGGTEQAIFVDALSGEVF